VFFEKLTVFTVQLKYYIDKWRSFRLIVKLCTLMVHFLFIGTLNQLPKAACFVLLRMWSVSGKRECWLLVICYPPVYMFLSGGVV
jgi:hypothetical protein